MSFTETCCNLSPVESNYTPKGKDVQVGDLLVYETGANDSQRLLICVYDIYGMHPVTKQFCDKVASSEYKVIMPDFFRGKQLGPELPKDRQVIMDFVSTTGSWDKVVRGDFLRLFEYYRGRGVTAIGSFGFCWGAKMSINASIDFPNDIKAIAIIHPSMVEDADAEKVNSPVLVLPASTDPDMTLFYANVSRRFQTSGHKRFDDVPHGFCAARGNMEDKLNCERVNEALALTFQFFKTNM